MRTPYLLILFYCLAASISVNAQSNQELISKLKKDRFSGSIFHVESKDTVLNLYSGYLDFTSGEPLEPSSRFEIGEITQSFTAYLILKFEEKGLLKLDQTLDTYFSESIPQKESISIRHLLQHKSGLSDFKKDRLWATGSEKAYTLNGFIESFLSYGLDFSPGSAFEYSTTNYYLLGILAERVGKNDYESLIKKYILEPNSLKETTIKRLAMPRLDQAIGFNWDKKRSVFDLAKSEHYSTTFSTSSILSTAKDLDKWMVICFKYLSQKMYLDLKLDDEFVCNYGWILSRFKPVNINNLIDSTSKEEKEQLYFWSTGNHEGFKSLLSLTISDSIRTCILSNTSKTDVLKLYQEIKKDL